ncbi:hypothetical protein YERSI8AC_240037 [Enterobacterales bacterium 8AC]|nr:hypothetical protein YERSI8AC_240037 [Enterobacterales bacterium 8AC]
MLYLQVRTSRFAANATVIINRKSQCGSVLYDNYLGERTITILTCRIQIAEQGLLCESNFMIGKSQA